jgi:tRNA threonylcarbamoyladenosine biosynthesis protein TsaB
VLVLAVESATGTAGVALADQSGVLASSTVDGGRRHTETIAPAIETLTGRLGLALSDLDALAVDIGPGLFTGLRVGVGTVQALAFALDRPVVAATSLDILARAVLEADPAEDRLVVPVVDARRGEVFATLVRSGSADPVDGAGDGVWAPEALALDLAARHEPVLAVGDGARRYRHLFEAVPGLTLAGPASPPVTVLAVLAVARAAAGGVVDGATLVPSYLRQADARINWEQRIAPRPSTGAATGDAP